MRWSRFLKQLGMMIVLDMFNGSIPAIKAFISFNKFFSPKSDFNHVLKELQEFKVEEFKKSSIFEKGQHLLLELIEKINR